LYAYNVLVTGNEITGGDEHGVVAYDRSVVRGNVIHESDGKGVYAEHSAQIIGNRIWGHAESGIESRGSSSAVGNLVYGNLIGIHAVSSPANISNNVVYGNTDVGIRIDGDSNSGMVIANNTVHQSTGRAIDVMGSTQNLVLRNNILVVDGGQTVGVI
jgi:parallel beta-helix repeat protein